MKLLMYSTAGRTFVNVVVVSIHHSVNSLCSNILVDQTCQTLSGQFKRKELFNNFKKSNACTGIHLNKCTLI
jgi:hypothetical protein